MGCPVPCGGEGEGELGEGVQEAGLESRNPGFVDRGAVVRPSWLESAWVVGQL